MIKTLMALAVLMQTGLFALDIYDPSALFKNSMRVTNDFIKKADPQLYSVVEKWDEHFKAEEALADKSYPVFFYLFTVGEEDGAGSSSLSYFTAAAAKLKRNHPEMRFYGVLKGFPQKQDRFLSLLQKEASAGDGTKGGVKIKFLPGMFDDLGIDRAPAYVFGMCKTDLQGGDNCNLYYLVRGAVGMEGFLGLMADNQPYYKGWLHDLIDAN